MNRKAILLRNLMYLYTSVFCAAIQNIVTQLFYDQHYPENKELYVGITLFGGAVFTMLGILASSRAKRTGTVILGGMIGVVILSFAGLFYVETFLMYTFLFCLASFCVNYVFNILDIFITATVKPEDQEWNVRILLGYQMAGYLIAPVFFSCFITKPRVCILFAVLMGLCSYVPAGIGYASDPGREIKGTDRQKKKSPVRSQDRAPLQFCFFMFMGVYLFMPSVAYLLKDYLHVEHYAVQSSLFLAGMVLFSSVVILCGPAWKMWRWRILSPVVLSAVLMFLLLFRSNQTAFLAGAAVAGGGGYGIFLSGSRYYVNTVGEEHHLIARYNQVMTGASLAGYLFSVLIGWICIQKQLPVVPVKYSIILLLFLLAAGSVRKEGTRRSRNQI